jgi:hypothetical protein
MIRDDINRAGWERAIDMNHPGYFSYINPDFFVWFDGSYWCRQVRGQALGEPPDQFPGNDGGLRRALML